MANSHTLLYNPSVYYKIVPAEDCSVNITAIGGGGGGGANGVSQSSEQTIFSTKSLVTNFLGGSGIVPVSPRTVVWTDDWNAYSQFTREHGVWEQYAFSNGTDDYGVEYISYAIVKTFDKTFTVNFPESGTYNFYIAFDRNAFVQIDGTTVYSQNNVNYAASNPTFVFQQYVNAGNRSIRFYVWRKGSGSAALHITKTLAPVTNSGGRGYSGDRVTANGIKLNKGQAIYALIGEGGKAATSSATWGNGGSALLGYNGGNGGRAENGKGGAGGGGGGATCVWRNADNLSDPSGTIYPPGFVGPIIPGSGIPGFYPESTISISGIVAGGGGGGGGGGTSSSAQVRNNYRHEPTPTYGKFADAELVTINYSAYNSFMNTNGVTLKGKFDSVGSFVFHRKITFPSTADYTFYIGGDDYVSVYLDNVPLIGGGQNVLIGQRINYIDANVSQGDHIITVKYQNFSQKNACAIAITLKGSDQVIWNTRSNLYSNVISEESFAPSFGGRGMSNSYGGGAGGGGGGGARGGRGGIYTSSDVTIGAYSGTEGSSYVSPLLEASGITLGNGNGNNAGNPGSNGGNGQVIVESTGLLNIFYRQNNTWVPVKEVKIFKDGSWINVEEVSIQDNNDQWKKVYTFQNVDLTLSQITTSGNTSYSVRSLSNPPILENLPQSTLSVLLNSTANSSGGSDSSSGDSGSSAISVSTQTFDDGSTLTTTTYSDGTTSYTSTDSTDSVGSGSVSSGMDTADYGGTGAPGSGP